MKKVSTTAAKESRNLSPQKLTIGLDLGDRSSYCVLDEAGHVLLELRLSTTRKAMSEVFGGMPPSRIALETGMHSPVGTWLLGTSPYPTIWRNHALAQSCTDSLRCAHVPTQRKARWVGHPAESKSFGISGPRFTSTGSNPVGDAAFRVVLISDTYRRLLLARESCCGVVGDIAMLRQPMEEGGNHRHHCERQ
jgi:hypothetical protein